MRYVPVEQARKRLGSLVRDVASGEPIVIGRRGTEQAILISWEEYGRLRRVEQEAAQARFAAALEAIAAEVRRERLPQRIVEEAVRAVRRRSGSSGEFRF